MQKKGRIQSVEIWRFIFAISIVLCHSSLIPWNYPGKAFFRVSTLGVEFFYILSGFLFAQGIDRAKLPPERLGEETWYYILNKIKRLLPEFLLAALLNFVVLFAVAGKNPFTDEWYEYLWDLTFLRGTGLGGLHETAVGGSWYLSAMFLAMAILYPLMRKNKDIFLHIVAPLTAFFILGWFRISAGTVGQALVFENGICLGLLRAIAELCIGCVCYTVTQKLEKKGTCSIQQKKCVSDIIRTVLWTLAEIVPLVIVLYINATSARSAKDFVCIALIAVSIVAAFSGRSFTAAIVFPKKLIAWFSRMSLMLYLTHYVWARMFAACNFQLTFRTQLILYVILSFVSAQVCMLVVDALKELPKLLAKNQQKNPDSSINA